jgi:hypothetical protein
LSDCPAGNELLNPILDGGAALSAVFEVQEVRRGRELAGGEESDEVVLLALVVVDGALDASRRCDSNALAKRAAGEAVVGPEDDVEAR